MLISGKEISKKRKEALRQENERLLLQNRRAPLLSVILVGDNPASKSYVKSKAKGCEAAGMKNRTIELPGDISQEELEAVVRHENSDPNVDGILLQLPLPAHLDERNALACIDPEKDVDGLHPVNAGKLMLGEKGFIPCTPKGIMSMLQEIGLDDLSGKRAVVIGRSNLVGKPVAQLLQQKNATVTTIHSRTTNAKDIAKEADILVVAMGKAHYVNAEWVKDGAVVIDVGINRVDGKITGDVDFDSVKDKAGFITPVPGGVGLMTVCSLLENTMESYKRREGIE